MEHQYAQRYGGDHDIGWRTALRLAEGVEDAADRAIWNEPDHPQLQAAIENDGLARLLIERDIKHVISEGTIPDTHHPDESDYVRHVRQLREEGSDGILRMQGLLEEDEMEVLIKYIHDTTGREHPGWLSDSLFRMWRERHGFWFWGTVTYKDWRSTLVDEGLPFTNGPHGTAALQRHFLLTTDARAATIKKRLELAQVRWNSASISEQMSETVHPGKKICIRMISNKSATFSGGGSGEPLKDLTEDLTRRIEHDETEHPSGKEGVQAILQRRLAARSKANRDMSMRKAMVTIGAKPEERQLLACILLGSLSDAHEFTVAMFDTGCTAYQVGTQEVMRYPQKSTSD